MSKNKLGRTLSVLVALPILLSAFVSIAAKPGGTVNVQRLAVNDFHGNLQPPSGSSGRVGTINAGGVEYLSTHINTLRATNPNTVVVSAGDTVGARSEERRGGEGGR